MTEEVINLFKSLEKKRISLPDDVIVILSGCKTFSTFDTVRQLATAAVGGDNNCFEVKYDIPGKGEVSEAIIHKVTNGISANYTEAYMRRRDPDTMAIADNLPSDKERFSDKFGYDFDVLRKETIHWLQSQELAVFFYFAGNDSIGSGGIAITPANAGFFVHLRFHISPITGVGRLFYIVRDDCTFFDIFPVHKCNSRPLVTLVISCETSL